MTQASSMTPLEAWRAATASSAALLRQNDLGRLAPGMVADFAILDGHLDDLQALRERIRCVVLGGRQVR